MARLPVERAAGAWSVTLTEPIHPDAGTVAHRTDWQHTVPHARCTGARGYARSAAHADQLGAVACTSPGCFPPGGEG